MGKKPTRNLQKKHSRIVTNTTIQFNYSMKFHTMRVQITFVRELL